MADTDDHYKRVEDKKWRDSVNEKLASLTAGQVVQDDRIEELEEELQAIKELLHGKESDRNDLGLKGDLEANEAQLRRINAILWPDPTGNAGLVGTVSQLAKQELRKEKHADRKTQILLAIIGALVTAMGYLNLDKVVSLFKKEPPAVTAPVKSKKPKKRAAIPKTEAPRNGPDEDMPE